MWYHKDDFMTPYYAEQEGVELILLFCNPQYDISNSYGKAVFFLILKSFECMKLYL